MLLHSKSPSAVGIPCWRAQVGCEESVVWSACVLVHVCNFGGGAAAAAELYTNSGVRVSEATKAMVRGALGTCCMAAGGVCAAAAAAAAAAALAFSYSTDT